MDGFERIFMRVIGHLAVLIKESVVALMVGRPGAD
jgi:hypothetical protein